MTRHAFAYGRTKPTHRRCLFCAKEVRVVSLRTVSHSGMVDRIDVAGPHRNQDGAICAGGLAPNGRTQ